MEETLEDYLKDHVLMGVIDTSKDACGCDCSGVGKKVYVFTSKEAAAILANPPSDAFLCVPKLEK